MSPASHGKRRRAPRRLAGSYKVLVFDLMNTLLWGKRGHRAHLAQFYRLAFNLSRNVSNQHILDVVDLMSVQFATRNRDWSPDLRIPLLNAAIGQALNPIAFGEMHPRCDELITRGQRVQQMYQTVGCGDDKADPWKLDSVVLQMLREIDAAGIPMALGTNQTATNVRGALERRGLNVFFPSNRVFISEELDTFKPRPEFIHAVAERLAVEVKDILYVGNSPTKDAPLSLPDAGCQVILLDHDGRYRVELSGTQFREKHSTALSHRRLLLTNSVAEVTDLLREAYFR